MVLKNFINYLINKYLKNYVERLDYEKVKVNLKSGLYDTGRFSSRFISSTLGNIFLENLHIKREALVSRIIVEPERGNFVLFRPI